jgi:hypothetical protein
MNRRQRSHELDAAATNRSVPGIVSRTPRPLVRALQLALLSGTLGATLLHAAPPVIPLSGLDGGNGYRLDGVSPYDSSGRLVSAAGDINGDGIDDLLVGAHRAGPNGVTYAGSSYVVFGRSGSFGSAIHLSTLNGSNGFRLDGAAQFDNSGFALAAAGDINGDGIDDMIIGAPTADPSGLDSGSSYVVFGRTGGFASAVNLSTLDGSIGFRLDGVAVNDRSGRPVAAAGDINGDDIDDLIIAAYAASPNGVTNAGSSYVVFGRSGSFASAINLSTLDGSNGFRLDGAASNNFSGRAISAAGDINEDGIDDLIIGAERASPNGVTYAGSSYVVFGRSGSFEAAINLSTLNGSTGFRLDGVEALDVSGRAVSAAGDINGDGIDDLIIGAPGADPNGVDDAGSSYVVFGRSGSFDAAIHLSTLNGNTGFRLDGVAVDDKSGLAVSAAGDIDGDGIDDLIIGVTDADPNGMNSAGSSYVVFGRSGSFDAAINLSTLDGSTGFRLDGAAIEDRSGVDLSAAGDINGDGIDDLLIGAFGADPNGVTDSGSSYVVYGARDRIFRDGVDDQNIDLRYPRLEVRNSFIGSALRWQNGAACNCDDAPFDFNLYNAGGNLAFFWPVAGLDGGVANGIVYSVLQPGAVIGPSSNFSADSTAAATANWRVGVDGYLGFRYVNAVTGLLTYGYARIRSTAPTGYPVEVIDFGVNLTGQAVTIPAQ